LRSSSCRRIILSDSVQDDVCDISEFTMLEVRRIRAATWSWVWLLASGIVLASCASEPSVIFPPEPEPLRVSFSRDVLGMLVGVSTTVAVEVAGGPAGIDRRVAFTSSDSSILTLSPPIGNETVLRAIRVGTARVTAASIVDHFVRDTLDVIVVSWTSPTPAIVVTAIRPAGSTVSVDSTNVFGVIDVHYAVGDARIGWRVELALATAPTVPCAVLLQPEFAGVCSVDTAARDSAGTPRYANGPRDLSVQLVREDSVIVASSHRTIVLNNPR
jgi:hypothetical protein